MNIKNVYAIILLIFVFHTQNINSIYSQYDSIKGYNDIEFGETFESAIKKFKDKKISFDTIPSDLEVIIYSDNLSLINYSENINLIIEYEKVNFLLKVHMYFDRNNDNKFCQAKYYVLKKSNNMEIPRKEFNEFFKLYLEKYGLDYKEYNYLDSINDSDIIDDKIFASKTLTYIWKNLNSNIELELIVSDLFEPLNKEDDVSKRKYSSNLKESGGYYHIQCRYYDANLFRYFSNHSLDRGYKNRIKEREKLKEKF